MKEAMEGTGKIGREKKGCPAQRDPDPLFSLSVYTGCNNGYDGRKGRHGKDGPFRMKALSWIREED